MGGQRHLQDQHPAGTGLVGKVLSDVYGGTLTTQDELVQSVEVGQPDPACLAGAEANLLHLRLEETDDGQHPTRGGEGSIGHQTSSFPHQQERCLPGDRAGGSAGGDLAHAVAGHHLDPVQSEALSIGLEGGPADRHQAGLQVLGAVQLSVRPFETKAPDRHLQDVLGAGQDLVGDAGNRCQLSSHAGSLHPLTGEEQTHRPLQRDRGCRQGDAGGGHGWLAAV